MDIIPLIILGYERDRHIAGLHFLTAKRPLNKIPKIYIAFSNQEPYRSIAEENAKYIENLTPLVCPGASVEKVTFNSFSLEHITELISSVIERERCKEGEAEVWIDLTSTTKEVIALSTFFTLFGVRIYWVTSPLVKGETRIKQRIIECFSTIKQSYLDSLDKLVTDIENARSQKGKREKLEKFFEETAEKYLRATMEQYKTRKAIHMVEMPIRTFERSRALLKSIRLKEIHRKLLLDLKAKDLALKEIQQKNRKQSQMALRYSLMQLGSLGFVKIRERRYGLTGIGRGYAAGIERSMPSATRTTTEAT